MVADWYRNPEKEVTVYATACGRNFFTRPSAPIGDETDPKVREEILADAAELLKVAEWHMYPEKPVTVYATACGRNFFSRPSAPQFEADDELEEERLRILADAKQLKEVAGWYAHPDQPVKSDGFATARNFFTRPSAPEYSEDAEESERILAEAKELKEVAGWYANPDQPVKSDGFASARNYFTRSSAPEQEEDDAEECEKILAEAKQLKEVASWYLQPEKPVEVDPTVFGRNYFNRPSAEQSSEANEERARIISDGTELKTIATITLIMITTTMIVTSLSSHTIAMVTTLTWMKICMYSVIPSMLFTTLSLPRTTLNTSPVSRKKTMARKAISHDPHLPSCFLTSRLPSNKLQFIHSRRRTDY